MGTPIRIFSKPGVKRDGTEFEGDVYVAGQWTRFRRGLPRKMKGYRAITQALNGPIHSVFTHSSTIITRIYTGSSNALEYLDVDSGTGIGGGTAGRGVTGLVPNNSNVWTFGEMYNGGSAYNAILAHVAPNLSCICSETNMIPATGQMMGTATLTAVTMPAVAATGVSGGVFSAPPYGFAYGSDGFIAWCIPNTPTDFSGVGSGYAWVTQNKIIYGAQVRGGNGANPAFLLWSTDSVIRGTFVGTAAGTFNFDTVSSESSIISSRSVVEFNGAYFWVGMGTFLAYNGVVQTLPNDMNRDWFFDNLNWNQRQKVWGEKVPEFGEIWWHYPTGDSTECNRAIVYNVEQQIWYDSEIARSAGWMPSVLHYPVWSAVNEVSTNTYARPLGGTASSSAGVPANAFDADLATTCAAGVNGTITYDFGDGASKVISRVGIASSGTLTLDLIWEYCNDSGTVLTNWSTLYDAASQSYTDAVDTYFTVATTTCRAVRVRETAGGTFSAREVYLNAFGAILYQHEFGVDKSLGSSLTAIPAYIETNAISAMDQGQDQWTAVARIEPDFVQEGDMLVELLARRYPRSSETTTSSTFGPTTEKIDVRFQGRQLRFRFSSNQQGGYFEMGHVTAIVEPGDVRQ